jgi:NAD(P)-dependent dehydrogenase (short-subunit alcohol dehydrogenase family)
MASLGGAGESVAVVVGAGELGSAMATLLAGAGFTVVAVGRHPARLRADPAVGAGSCRQRAGLLRGAGGEELVLGHRPLTTDSKQDWRPEQ